MNSILGRNRQLERRRAVRCAHAVVLGLLLAAPAAAAAQQPQTDSVRRWITSGSVGVIGAEGYTSLELLTLSVGWTGAAQHGLVPDFALSTVPRTLQYGAALLGGRAGAAIPVPLREGATLLPSAGVTAIGAVGSGGGGGAWGYNVGGSFVALAKSGLGLRMGVTWHRVESDRWFWLFEVGVARGPRRASE